MGKFPVTEGSHPLQCNSVPGDAEGGLHHRESEERIRPYGELGSYLHEIRPRRPSYQSAMKGFFDLGAVAGLVDPSLICWEVVDAPGVNWDMLYEWKEPLGKMLRIYQIDRDCTFQLLHKKLAKNYPTPVSTAG